MYRKIRKTFRRELHEATVIAVKRALASEECAVLIDKQLGSYLNRANNMKSDAR